MDYCVLVRICCNLFQRKTENFMKENLRSFSFRSLSNKSIKSIANYRNRSKSIITKTRVIDFYRIPIVIDWLVSITIDYVRFLSSIENIDLLRPAYTYSCIDRRIKCAFQMPPCIMFSLHVAIAFFCFVFLWGEKINSGETTDVWNPATCIKKPLPTWCEEDNNIQFTLQVCVLWHFQSSVRFICLYV